MRMSYAHITESTWSVPVAALLLVGMLAAFYLVVSEATKAAEVRRQASATQAAAVMRCKALPSWAQSKACRTQLELRRAGNPAIELASQP